MESIIPDCAACRAGPLDLHQPSEADPETLIGVCPVCGASFACAPIAEPLGWDGGEGFVIVGRVGLLEAG